jgi:hypothetical protein
MAVPNDPDLLKHTRHLYGNFTRKEGGYWFEWTPFTPAVLAWQSAERYLRTAVAELHNAREIYGFAIPGLETEFDQYKQAVKVLAEYVEDRRREARTVTRALDLANTTYAKAHDASAAEYRRVMGIVNTATQEQARPSPVINTLPVPGDTNAVRRIPLPTSAGSENGN